MQEAIAKLEAPDAGKAAIVDHFQELVDCLASDHTRWGCLITNVAVELCNHDNEAANRIHQSLQRIEHAFHHALQNAQSQGELASDADITALACFLTCMIQGLRVMVKIGPEPQALNQIINTTLSVLDVTLSDRQPVQTST